MERTGLRYLAVAAHADDFELFATCVCDLGDVTVCVVTAPSPPRRYEELLCAAELLDYDLLCWNFPDGFTYMQDMRGSIARLFKEYRPDVVLTHDPWKRFQLHPDHRTVGMQTVDAITQARLLCTHIPSELWLWNTDHPTLNLSCSSLKGEAIRCYKSQGFGKHQLRDTTEAFKLIVPQGEWG